MEPTNGLVLNDGFDRADCVQHKFCESLYSQAPFGTMLSKTLQCLQADSLTYADLETCSIHFSKNADPF